MGFKVAVTIDLPPWLLDKRPLDHLQVEFVKQQCNTEDEVIALAGEADAVICSSEPFTRKVIQRLCRCKIIAVEAAGYQDVDVEAATECAIVVTNVADYCSEEVSDHTMAMILALNRRLFQVCRIARSGTWGMPQYRTLLGPVSRLRGQTLGIIGLGKIGQALVPKAQAFGLRVLVYSTHTRPEVANSLGVELSDLDRLLRESDYVSVHSAMAPERRRILGIDQFRLMRPTSFLINSARGGLIDESALISALSEGLIAGAALDVTDPEPPSLDNPLFQRDDVIITPHSAAFSDAAMAELIRRPAEEIARVLQGNWPSTPVNPKVRGRFKERWGW